MGATDFTLDESDIFLTLDSGLNLSPKSLNALRREAVERLYATRRTLPKEKPYAPAGGYKTAPTRSALFFDEREFITIAERFPEYGKYFDLRFLPLFSSDRALSLAEGVYLPPVIRNSEWNEVKAQLEKAKKLGILYTLVGNLSQISLSKELGLIPIGDFRLNITNGHTREALLSLGLEKFILSPELTLPKARDIGGSVIGYGRIPLMLTERCFTREISDCKSCGRASLVDRRGEKFPLIREYKHRTVILNSKHTYMGDRGAELSQNKIRSLHFLFTTERADEIRAAIDSFKSAKPLFGTEVRRVGRRKHNKK
jgi:putative protease